MGLTSLREHKLLAVQSATNAQRAGTRPGGAGLCKARHGVILEKLRCAHFSEPLKYINCGLLSDLHFLSSISYWVVSCPKVDDQQPLLKGHPRL